MGYNKKTSSLRKLADQRWKEVCFLKWGDKCVSCNRPASDPHHYIPKSVCLGLRYDTDNCVPLCCLCHSLIKFNQGAVIDGFIIKNRGVKWFDNLIEKKKLYQKMPVKNNQMWLKQVLTNLEKEYVSYTTRI